MLKLAGPLAACWLWLRRALAHEIESLSGVNYFYLSTCGVIGFTGKPEVDLCNADLSI